MLELDWIVACYGLGQEQNRLLNIRSQLQQDHDLTDACQTHHAQAGQFRVVLDHAGYHQPHEVMSECGGCDLRVEQGTSTLV